MEVGSGQRAARLQEREARLHHRHPEALGVRADPCCFFSPLFFFLLILLVVFAGRRREASI